MANELVTSPPHVLDILAALIDTGGYLEDATLTLFENDVNPTETSVVGDFTDATYTGEAPEVIAWLAPSISDDGNPQIVGIAGEFRPTATSAGKVVYGAILKTTGGDYIGGVRFEDAPIPMAEVTDSIVLTPAYRMTDGGPVVVVS